MIKYVSNFDDYKILDSGNGEKIEQFGSYLLKRPDPQALWEPIDFSKYKLNAIYHRSSAGGGNWEFINLPHVWDIKYNLYDEKMVFNLKPFNFKHTGIFPEQAVNWNKIYDFIKTKNDFKMLNLFAYTGGATIAGALAGAKVTHVDASKGMVSWAHENAIISNVPNDKIRWIVDDCKKFVEREIRRGNVYNGIVMDPPSYGRGTNGEVWKMEDMIYDFIYDVFSLLYKTNSFLLVNSYTTGLAPATIDYIVNDIAKKHHIKCKTESYEIGIKVESTGLVMPEGASTFMMC